MSREQSADMERLAADVQRFGRDVQGGAADVQRFGRDVPRVATNAQRVAALVAAGWGVAAADVQPLRGGLIGGTWKVVAADGTPWFLKEYAPDLADSATSTLEVQEFARTRGLPVPAVRPTRDGLLVYRPGGATMALSEFLPGEALRPHDLSPGHLTAAGEVLARLHLALQDHTGSAGPVQLPADTAALEEALRGVEAMVRRRAFSPPVDALVRRCVETKREALAHWALGPRLYAGASWQMLHRDFRLENLLFDPTGGVSAVLDFDFARAGYRAWELMRAAMTATWLVNDLAGPAGEGVEPARAGMDLERAGILLRAYLARVPVAPEEVRSLGRLWLDSLVRTFWPISLPYETPAVWHDGLAQILRDRDDYTRWLSDQLEDVEDWLGGLVR